MKPQIVMQEVGRHGQDLPATADRIVRGASWKKQRIVVILPSADVIAAKVALSYWGLIFPPNQPVVRMLALGQEVGEAYSNCIEQILAHPELGKWEYILTIESDNAPPQDGVINLVKAMEEHPELAAISGGYFTKGEGGVAQAWGEIADPQMNFRPQVPTPGQIQEVYGLGMGFCLYRMKMFRDERIEKPWFRTKASKNEGVGTQDLHFWANARKQGYRCAVDWRVIVGHYDLEGKFGQPDMMW